MSQASTPDDGMQPAPPPVAPAEAPRTGHGSGAAILLAIAAVVAAVLLARASFVAGAASAQWQKAVREELKRSAALVEDVRFVYTDEAPLAFIAVGAQTLAEELRAKVDQAPADQRERLVIEARSHELLVETLGPASAIVSGDYEAELGGYDLGARLADVRDENPDLVALNPQDAQDLGDRLSDQASSQTAASVLAAVAFLFAALAQVFRRGHWLWLILGWIALAGAAGAGIVVEVLA